MIAEPILKSAFYNKVLLLLSVFLLTFLLFAIRFVMIYGFYAFRIKKLHKSLDKYVKDMPSPYLFWCEGNCIHCHYPFDTV